MYKRLFTCNCTLLKMPSVKVVNIVLLLSVAKCEITNLGIFPIIPNVVEYGDNSLCRNESKIYQENLGNDTLWAHKMLDSSAKGTFGVLERNNYQFGSYDECLNLAGPFPTQYCLISLRINAPVTNPSGSSESYLRESPYSSVFVKLQKPIHNLPQRGDTLEIGLCLPASCSALDIQNSLGQTLKVTGTPYKNKNVTYEVITNGDNCVSQSNAKIFGIGETAFCALTVTLILLVLLGTTVDSMLKENINDSKQNWVKICLAFSAKRNWKDLLRTYENETKVFSGVRTISMMMVVIGHKGLLLTQGPFLQGEILEYVAHYKFDYFLESITVVVNTFFVMSGLFLSYGLMKRVKISNTNWLGLVLVRYTRLTPLIAYVTFYFTTMLYFTGSGPVWNQIVKPQVLACQKNWWWNIFYINNFLNKFEDICNFPTWFISCDFQLFIFGLLMMFLIRKYQTIGYSILGLFFLISIVTPFVISLTYELTPFIGLVHDYKSFQFWNLYYTKPYNHASSHILGMLGGIGYHNWKSNKIKFSKKLAIFIFSVCTFFMVASFGWGILFHYHKSSAFAIGLYNSLHRLIWSIGVLGICIAVSFGPFSSFLNWSIWIPLSKLSFGVFLIHITVIIPGIAGTFVAIQPTIHSVLISLIGETVMMYMAAFLLYLYLEAPAAKIFKLILLERQVNTDVETHA